VDSLASSQKLPPIGLTRTECLAKVKKRVPVSSAANAPTRAPLRPGLPLIAQSIPKLIAQLIGQLIAHQLVGMP
jgi:hypothetical protein